MQPPFIYQPPSSPLDIVLKDDDVLVLNKPSGLLSVPGKAAEHQDCLETRTKSEFPEALLVHRLDMDTSGIMIFARNKNAQRHLGLQFEKRQLEKTYVAVVNGVLTENSGTIDLPLIVDWPNRPLQMVDYGRGKPAITHWEIIERNNQSTRVCLKPKTGRSHQLRVHMQQIGHPILGDRFYADPKSIQSGDRLKLHAEMLKFRHPSGGDWVTVTTPCDF